MADKFSVGTASVTTAKVGRSPAYPAFSLSTAVDKIATLYAVQRNNAVSIDAAADSLGYQTAKSGTAQRTIAALISYGLLSEEGSGQTRRVRVTELGRKIMLLKEDDSDRESAIQEAALRPKIYKEMLEQWPESLPSDTELSKYLTFSKGYNEDTVRTLISAFRSTYDFAKLGKHPANLHDAHKQETVRVAEKRKGESQGFSNDNQARFDPLQHTGNVDQETAQRILHIPITGGRVAVLQTPSSVSEEDYEFLQKYLEFFKGAIITRKAAQETSSRTSQHPDVQTGPAIWHTKEHDIPIIVTGYLGERDGSHYASTEGSTSGVPIDEILYE